MQISVSITKYALGWLVKVRSTANTQGIELIMPTHQEAIAEANRLVALRGKI